MTTLKDEKQRLRREILARRDALSAAHRVIRSADILQRLFELEEMRSASWVHFYVSYGSEVETTGMIAHALAQGKHVAVPVMDTASNRLILSELKDPVGELAPRREPPGRGIREPRPEAVRPVEPGRMNLMIVPGIAFDEEGRRLGKGAGYYDRLLTSPSARIPIVALAFELQLVPEVPIGDQDVRVDWIVTEKRVIETVRNRTSLRGGEADEAIH